ncbi:MAG: hypothetical protein IJ011_05375 [Clostridia bacterium]|nr:hypothetical protein [Clostridia bacterium]
MTNKKSTMRALIASVVSLLLCFTMLLGTTYAWFTDSVTSANNIIQTGNLDVELYWSTDANTWKEVDANTNVFTGDLWEPGHAEVVYLKVVNAGSLALKYQLGVNIASETGSTNVLGNEFKISEYIKYGVVDCTKTNDVYDVFANRAAAIEAVNAVSTKLSVAYASATTPLYPANNSESLASEKVVAMVVYMPETVGNEANYAKDAETKPEIKLGINLFASQVDYENDSFGNDYDKNAGAWDGETADTTWYDANKSEYVLYTAAELAGLSKLVNEGNNFSGKTVKLGADIDLSNKAWTPIGRMINTSGTGENSTFKGNFDGQGHTVYNLNVDTVDDVDDTNKGAGLFGAITGNISNVNVVGATIKTAHWAGAIAGSIEGSITNCSVDNVSINCLPELIGEEWDNGDKAGAIVGYATNGTITNCKVGNATITAYRDMGAIAGASYNSVVDSAVVGKVTLAKDNNETSDYKGTADDTTVKAFVGTIYGGATVNATGEENVTIVGACSVVGSDKAAVTAAINAAKPGDTVVLTENTTIAGYNANYKLIIEKAITLDLNGHTITTESGWGGIDAKGGCSIVNGTINHTGNTAAIKAFQVERIENVTINVTQTEGKTKGGIVVQEGEGCYIGSIKNVTITGATNGIETYRCGARTDLAIGSITNVTIDATDTGILLSAPIGAITNSTIEGDKIGINAYLYGPYSVTAELVNSTVTGACGIYAHDEVAKTNPGTLTITADADSVINGGVTQEFEAEVAERVTIEIAE